MKAGSCHRCWGTGLANGPYWRDHGEHQDMRTWFQREPAFETHIDMVTILPDEHDLIELGTRVAVTYLCDLTKDRPHQWIWKYRR